MKAAWSVLLALLAVCFLVAGLQAQEKDGKEVTLKGTFVCPKCELGETDKCANAIKVKEGGKDVVYYFDDKGAKEPYHKEFCKEPKAGSVKGVVSEKDGKKIIKPAKDGVKFDK